MSDSRTDPIAIEREYDANHVTTPATHIKRAEYWMAAGMNAAEERGDVEFASYALAVGQLHATLAIAKIQEQL